MIANLLRAGLLTAAVALAGCNAAEIEQVTTVGTVKAEKQLSAKRVAELQKKGMTRTSPIIARIFKEEAKLEIWKQKTNGRYDIVASYNICKMSGKLGPKFIEGDRQAPEGFYTVRPSQMNPNSSYHLAFNIGYPNAYDRANGRTGSNLMVHGACSSSGCFAVTDREIEEIYAFGRDAFRGGQTEFQVQSFPFRMTAANMARYRNDPNFEFWTMLKEGYDQFELTKVPPKVDVCEKRYVFNRIPEGTATFNPTGACPPSAQPNTLTTAYQSYAKNYDAAFAVAAKKGDKVPPKPSIAGLQEANIVSDWTKKRARGERISIEPPSMNADGTITQTSQMGRIDSPAGRKQAALDAAAAQKAKAEAEKKALELAKAEEKKRLEEEAKAAAEAAKVAESAPAAEPSVVPASAEAPPAEGSGFLSGARKRIVNIFGS
ncbi:murein L,D-transpeptidase family protein [Mesorhizobium sp. VNQ89]|uniref:L,D-transpeptidase family protein n=1 Tax=Mesorhizobium quangtriensis TaxID=3157709 RepID=UPI0032B811C7